MRLAKEKDIWSWVNGKGNRYSPLGVQFGGQELDLTDPCLVVGGLNGAGKSRLLRTISNACPNNTVLLDMHFLCEQVLGVLRSRQDISQMAEESASEEISDERKEDVTRIISRDYSEMEWTAVEFEPADEGVAELLKWGGDQSYLPYFSVEYGGVAYSSREMGLGEFSVHLLFWIIDQYREAKDLVLLLDEPDAYLPPVGVSRLLRRLLRICKARKWRMVMATHSSEIIAEASRHGVFSLMLRTGPAESELLPSAVDPFVGDCLLDEPPVRNIIFVEDETAAAFVYAVLRGISERHVKTSFVSWVSGSGNLSKLREILPYHAKDPVKYLFMPDGDQRQNSDFLKGGRYPVIFLPTSSDPDSLLKSLSDDLPALHARLGSIVTGLKQALLRNEASDSHDWVNAIAKGPERTVVLRSLSEMWINRNLDSVDELRSQLRDYLVC